MSVFVEAYTQGQQAAFEKFAGGMSAAGIRGVAPGQMKAPALVNDVTGHMPAATPKPGGLMGSAPGWAQKAWGGLNRVAANPIGSMALGTGLMMGVGKLMEPSNNP